MKLTKIIAVFAAVFVFYAAQANALEVSTYGSLKANTGKLSLDKQKAYPDEFSTMGNGKQSESVSGISAAVGILVPAEKILSNVRAEIEFYLNQDVTFSNEIEQNSGAVIVGFHGYNKQTVGSKSVFINLYNDFQTGTVFTPYIGGGVGFSNVSVSESMKDSNYGFESQYNDTNFSWQVGAGVGIALSKNAVLDIGYRYVDYGSVSGSANGYFRNTFAGKVDREFDLSSGQFTIGTRILF